MNTTVNTEEILSLGDAARALGYTATEFRRMVRNIDKRAQYRIADWAEAAGLSTEGLR